MHRVLWWLVVAAGCEPTPPASMSDIAFPDGFQLTTARTVHIEVRGATEGRLRIAASDGSPLFVGDAAYAVANGLQLTLPPHVRALDVTHTVRGASTTERVEVSSSDVTLRLGS